MEVENVTPGNTFECTRRGNESVTCHFLGIIYEDDEAQKLNVLLMDCTTVL